MYMYEMESKLSLTPKIDRGRAKTIGLLILWSLQVP